MPTGNPGPTAVDPGRLVKALGYALRHNPWAFGLPLSEDGFAPFDAVVSALRSRRPEYRAASADELA